jgi:diguanylate cyclase (GGDEF)-like protein
MESEGLRDRVLIVDDDPEVRAVLGAYLAHATREILAASCVSEAVAIATRTRRVDVGLVDHHLPDGSGYQLIEALLERDPACQPIIITGDLSIDAAAAAVRTGARDYLTKPLDLPVVDSVVGRSASLARASRARASADRTLREQGQRFSLATTAADEGIWDWDVIGHSVFYSAQWKAQLGLSNAGIGASPDEWLSRIHRGDVDRVTTAIEGVVCGVKAHLDVDYRIRYVNGTYRWMLARGTVLRDERGQAYRLAGTQVDITDHKRLELRLRYRTLHDSLTGLPNRECFYHHLHRAFAAWTRDASRDFGVLFVDVDHFKEANDTMGHVAADALLAGVAGRLRQSVRESDVAARLGGDEFGALVVGGAEAAAAVCERFVELLRRPIAVGEQLRVVTASVGIAGPSPACADALDLLRQADRAMYRVKSTGRFRAVSADSV